MGLVRTIVKNCIGWSRIELKARLFEAKVSGLIIWKEMDADLSYFEVDVFILVHHFAWEVDGFVFVDNLKAIVFRDELSTYLIAHDMVW